MIINCRVDDYKIYISEHQTRKQLNFKLLEDLLTQWYSDNAEDTSKVSELATYLWSNRPMEVRSYIKISKPRRKRSKKND